TDKTEATEIVIIDSQMNYRGKLDTYPFSAGDCICAIKVDNKRIRKTSLSGRRLFCFLWNKNNEKRMRK
ncbi:hypothetical protein, partial [Dialister succinatiphilus]|uniref:hypothetical protein n=1 Tax=Dialister succinatiphilus TaxID=487173 RepID=UPI003F7F62A0